MSLPLRRAVAGLNLLTVAVNRKFHLAYLLPLIVVAAMLAGCGESRVGDTLILADGSIRTGSLEGCTAEFCVFNRREVPQATILYIGLGADMPPPSPRDPTRDEVHRIDKSIHPGPLRSVDAATVFAATNHNRKQVAWIWLTPADVPPLAQRSPGDRDSGGRGCNRREVFLYDVLVTGEKSGSETVQNLSGEFAFSYVYSARYPRVPVTLERECETGDIKISGPTDGDPHPGSGTLTSYVWRDSITGKEFVLTDSNIFNLRGDGTAPVMKDNRVACGFDVAIDGLGVQIELGGYVAGSGSPPGSRSNFSVYSRSRDGEDRHGSLISARHKEECNKGTQSNISVFDGLASHGHEADVQLYGKPSQVGGMSLEQPRLNLVGLFSFNGVEVPTTLRALVRGDSFSVSSGRRTWQKTYEGTNKQERASTATSMTVTFSRAR